MRDAEAQAAFHALLEQRERLAGDWQARALRLLADYERLESEERRLLAAVGTAVKSHDATAPVAHDGRPITLARLIRTYERTLIEWALATAGGVQKDAARLLGLRATTLNEKMKRLGIPRGSQRPTFRDDSLTRRAQVLTSPERFGT